jgi:hypothetical protein
MLRAFSDFLGFFATWMQFVISPSPAITHLANDVERSRSVVPVIKIWFAAIIISIIVQIPTLRVFGVEWSNIGYPTVTVTVSLIIMCCGSILTHFTMIMLGLYSDLLITLALYTVCIIYGPVSSLILTDKSYQLLHAIYIMKLSGAETLTVKEIITQLATPVPMFQREMPLAVIDILATYGAVVVGTLAMAAFAEFLVQWYGNSRYKTYLAVAWGNISLIVVFLVVFLPIELMILYSFMERGK